MREYELDPLELGVDALRPGGAARRRPGDERGGAARRCSRGADGGHRSAVLLNAAGAIAAAGHADDLREGIEPRARGDRLRRGGERLDGCRVLAGEPWPR